MEPIDRYAQVKRMWFLILSYFYILFQIAIFIFTFVYVKKFNDNRYKCSVEEFDAQSIYVFFIIIQVLGSILNLYTIASIINKRNEGGWIISIFIVSFVQIATIISVDTNLLFTECFIHEFPQLFGLTIISIIFDCFITGLFMGLISISIFLTIIIFPIYTFMEWLKEKKYIECLKKCYNYFSNCFLNCFCFFPKFIQSNINYVNTGKFSPIITNEEIINEEIINPIVTPIAIPIEIV